MSRPLILLRQFHHCSANRVQVDVTHQFKEVIVCVDEDGFVPAVKEMADAPVFSVYPGCVTECQVLHHTGKGDITHLDEKVYMVRHKTEGMDAVMEQLGPVLKEEVKAIPVGVVEEDVLAGISTKNDVVNGSRIVDTRFTWHEAIYLQNV